MFTDKLGLKPRRFKSAFFTNMVKHHPMAKSPYPMLQCWEQITATADEKCDAASEPL